MAQFDNWPSFLDFSFQEFSFSVDRYKEWVAGRMISSGATHFNVYFKYDSRRKSFSSEIIIKLQI